MDTMEIMILLLLSAFAAFCIYKAVTTKPHKLKKPEDFTVNFRKDLPTIEQGEELACFYRKKDVLIPAVVLFLGFVVFVGLSIYYQTPGMLVGCLVCAPAFSFANDATRRISIHEYAIVNKSRLNTQIYWLRDLDRLESYNIISSLTFKGVSYGYRLVSHDNEVLLSLAVREYENLESIEDLFEKHPSILN